MNLIEIFERFPHQEACIEFLEGIRYKEGAYCPLCGSVGVAKKREKTHKGRWNCHDCKSSFKVVRGTMFHGTKILLQKWFLAIVLIANAKKSLSSHQLARDLKLNQKTAWYIMQRIRLEMAEKENKGLLEGILEVDEAFIGGKPRKPNIHGPGTNVPKSPTGGNSEKLNTIMGVVEREGRVKAQMVSRPTAKNAIEFLRSRVNPAESVLMSDESQIYKAAGKSFTSHEIIAHIDEYVRDGYVHTNTIEGFWSLLKRAWYGQHHHYKPEFVPLYIAEACWKYNNRERGNFFDHFVRGCFD